MVELGDDRDFGFNVTVGFGEIITLFPTLRLGSVTTLRLGSAVIVKYL